MIRTRANPLGPQCPIIDSDVALKLWHGPSLWVELRPEI